jgi:hypothetical protein
MAPTEDCHSEGGCTSSQRHFGQSVGIGRLRFHVFDYILLALAQLVKEGAVLSVTLYRYNCYRIWSTYLGRS